MHFFSYTNNVSISLKIILHFFNILKICVKLNENLSLQIFP